MFLYLLLPLSLFYFFIISIRNFLYRRGLLRFYVIKGARVISAGNIVWGGTGKTPLVLFISDLLLKKRLRFGIVTRGYGQDEVELFKRRLPGVPLFCGKDRARVMKEAKEKTGIDIFIADDAFQHLRLKRDLDIVCIDCLSPFGNGFLIPAGTLREPLSGLKRADIFLLTKSDLVSRKELDRIKKRLVLINSHALLAESVHEPMSFYTLTEKVMIDSGTLKGTHNVLLSAIASPLSFERTIEKTGVTFEKHFVFRDHHIYCEKDIRNIERYCRGNGIGRVIITEKDAVKLERLDYLPHKLEFVVLRIKMRITENEQGFYNRLYGILGC